MAADLYSRGSLDLNSVVRALESLGTSRSLRELYALEEETRRVSEFFEKCVGAPPWGAQRTWIKRFVRGDSFSIVAPTGMGKTTLGLVLALYLACAKREKTYIIAPTVTLVRQMREKLEAMAEASGCRDLVRVLSIHGKMSAAQKREISRAIEERDFDILITTVAYARRNADILRAARFRLLFVDDVDAVLKSGKSISAVLKIAGFSDEDLEFGSKLLQIEREIARIAESLAEASRERREELRAKLSQLQAERETLRREIQAKRREVSSLIVSSATGRPRGAKARVFRALLGFEAGGRSDIGLRNVIDSYLIASGDVVEEAIEIIKKLGKGTLVFVPSDWGVEKAEEVAARLREAGVNAQAYHSRTPFAVFEKFQKGEVDVLVGVAHYYGPLVRGIDLPEIVKYSVFVGVPRYKFPLAVGEIEPNPLALARVAELIAELGVPEVSDEARRILGELRRLLRKYTQGYLGYVIDMIKAGAESDERVRRAASTILKALDFAKRALANPEVIEKIKERSDVGVVFENGRTYILIADVSTYIQASGRTSRLYAGGLTKGLSVVVADNVNVLRRLIARSRYIADIKWVDFRSLAGELDKIVEEIELDRRRVAEILRKPEKPLERRELVKTSLLVVESPNKARTIAYFFGRPSVRILQGGLRAYEIALQNRVLVIAASGGHVYDLVPASGERELSIAARSLKNPADIFGVIVGESGERTAYVPVYSSIKTCLVCREQFAEDSESCPRCGSRLFRDSKTLIEDLRRLAWEADEVLIGTDPDTEGEKIGWDLAVLLRPFNKNIKRLEFHEVTRQAILQALENPRELEERLVEAQIVRRIEDRWIGFALSPLLWCDFWRNYYCASIDASPRRSEREAEACQRLRYNYGLSAGRVQTPALGWVVKRTSEATRKVSLFILKRSDTGEIFITIREDELKDPATVRALKELANRQRRGEEVLAEAKVRISSSRWVTIPPPPPFTTDTLILEASRRLGFGAPETMRLAQNLFEWGLITYHRTDSTRVSERGMEVALEWIKQAYGELAESLYVPRRWSERGAHEAIRPVRPVDANALQILIEEGSIEIPGTLTQRHLRLYDLIFRRFVASQMREAEVRETVYLIDVSGEILEVSRITELPSDRVKLGFLNVLREAVNVQNPLLPREMEESLLAGRQAFASIVYRVLEKKVSSTMPYTQGELVEEMKKRGIGRPSTYAKIVERLLKRGYIAPLKKPRGGYIVATKRGKMVYEYLVNLPELAADRLSAIAKHLAIVPSLISEERTRQLEEAMDEIEGGAKTWVQVLDDIYKEVEGLVHVIKSASREAAEETGVSGELAECIALKGATRGGSESAG